MFILELLFELVLEGITIGCMNKRVPLWIRICLGIILALFYLSVLALLIYAAVSAIIMKNSMMFLFSTALILFIVGGCILRLKRYLRKKGESQ